MDFELDIESLLASKRKQIANGGTNTIEVFRANYSAFEKLIKFYKMHRNFRLESGETAFGEIRKLLTAKGVVSRHGELSDDSIATYMCRVRAEEKSKGQSKPVAVKVTEMPVATTATVRQTVTPTPVAKPVLVVPGVEPIEVTDWIAELDRLEKEKDAPWNGQDEFMWNAMEKVAKSRFYDLRKDFFQVEKSLDAIQVHCLKFILPKRRKYFPK